MLSQSHLFCRLTRRHVETGDETPRAIRLELGSEGINLDMTLTRRSVWTRESRAYERREDEIVEVPLALDPSCFMAGDLNSGEGAASFSYCDGVVSVALFFGRIHEVAARTFQNEFGKG